MGVIKVLLKVIGALVALVVLAVVITLTAARFADGPWAVIAGGSFTSGEPAPTPTDWTFAKDIQEVEFELVSTGRSRTSWIMVQDGRAFIPSGYMNTPVGKIWKHWPFDAVEDGRAILRVDGTLYDVTMVRRMQDEPAMPGVLSEVTRKYIGAPVPMSEVSSSNTWVFELLPR